jgi:multidrug efflux system membrane fusion protein
MSDSQSSTSPAPLSHRPLLRRPGIWLLIALLLGGAFVWWRHAAAPTPDAAGGKHGFDKNRPQPVQVAPARQGDLGVYLSGLGTVTAANNVTVKSRVDGQLVRVLFKEGQAVKAGDLLAEIDPRPFQAALAQAQGQLAKDQAQLTNAEQDLVRYQTLIAQDSISKQQVDTQQALVRQLKGTLEADRGQVATAKLNLDYSRITAPASGRLGLRQVDPGNIVHASDANGLVTITQVTPIDVLFTLPESAISQVIKPLHAGTELKVDAYDREQAAKLASGKLMTIDNQIDPSTGTVKLKARFTNEDASLFPNQFVNVRLLVDTLKNATLIPSAAVQRGTPGTFVFVVNADKTVSLRPVKLGPADGDNLSISSGLKPGETVVVDGADKLKDGARVMLATPVTAGADGKAGGHGGKHGGNGKNWHKKQASGNQ